MPLSRKEVSLIANTMIPLKIYSILIRSKKNVNETRLLIKSLGELKSQYNDKHCKKLFLREK